jgi:hypothetical protein
MPKSQQTPEPLGIPGAYKVRTHWKVLIGRHEGVGKTDVPPQPPSCPPFCSSVMATTRSFAVFSPILPLALIIYLKMAGLAPALSVTHIIVILLISIVAGAISGAISAVVYNLTESKYDLYVSVDDLQEVVRHCMKETKSGG